MKSVQLRVFIATSVREKIVGLLQYTKPIPLLLKTRFGIHTFGLSYPIDVLILNATNEVVYLKHALKPNRIFLWNPRYNTVVELPTGMIRQKKITYGTKIIVLKYT